MKTLIAVPAAALLALSLSACGSSDTSANTSTNYEVLNVEDGADANLSDDALLSNEPALGNAALGGDPLANGSLGNDAVPLANGQ